MLNAMVLVDGWLNALCGITHGIRLIEDPEPSPRSGYPRRPRVSPPRRIDLGRRRTLTSTPEATAPPRVAHGDDASASRVCGQESGGPKSNNRKNSRYAPKPHVV